MSLTTKDAASFTVPSLGRFLREAKACRDRALQFRRARSFADAFDIADDADLHWLQDTLWLFPCTCGVLPNPQCPITKVGQADADQLRRMIRAKLRQHGGVSMRTVLKLWRRAEAAWGDVT